MKQVVDSYAGIWVIMILFLLAMSFTIINMNTIQARKIYNDLKAEVQASNGAIVDDTNRYYFSSSEGSDPLATLEDDGYQYECSIVRQNGLSDNISVDDETFIYNSLYKVSLKYEYYVPLFGKQVYPLTGYAY